MIMDDEEWQEDAMSWQEVEDHYVRLTGDHTFWKIDPVSVPDKDPGGVIVVSFHDLCTIMLNRIHNFLRQPCPQLFPPTLPLDEELPLKYRNYTGNDYAVYRQMIKRVAELFINHTRADVSEERLEKDIDDIIELEKALYMVRHSNEIL